MHAVYALLDESPVFAWSRWNFRTSAKLASGRYYKYYSYNYSNNPVSASQDLKEAHSQLLFVTGAGGAVRCE